MSSFAPSVQHAANAGHKVVRTVYPEGVAGVKLSLETIAAKIREGQQDPAVRGWAGDVLIAAGRPSGVRAQAQALLTALREATMYVPDPVNTEYIASAAATLCLRPGLCIRAADCDDLVTAYGSLLASVGIPVHVIKQRFSLEDQEHVLIEFQDEGGRWLAADPSASFPVGAKAPAMEEFVVDPWAPSMAGLSGPPAEFIGIGKVAHGLGRLPGKVIRRGVGNGGYAPKVYRPFAGYDQARKDLANQVSAIIGAGDSYFAGSDSQAALSAYKAAGQVGATNVGPEIDLGGYPAVTQPLTQEAWTYNTRLQATSDVDVARSLVHQMEALYQLAIARGQGALDTETGTGNAAPPPGGPEWTLTEALAYAAVAGAVAGGGWMVLKHRRRRR